jgi:PiT family inorganic phosphate transporter
MTWLVLLAVLFLAYTNGANDNFKPVATIYGSGSASYRRALAWATATQLAGSLLAVVLAGGLIATFSAKGLVPDAVASAPAFLAAAALGAMGTVLLATLIGMPISTTHALTGALTGAGLVAVGSAVNFAVLGKSFFLPLLVSPLLAMALTVALYPLARAARRALGVESETCVCVGNEWVPVSTLGGEAAARSAASISVGTKEVCVTRYRGSVVGVSVQAVLDGLHFLSAGAIGFARGLNDTPKILALALAAQALRADLGVPLIGAAMALGGVLNARKVAETMSHKITTLNAGQGLVANLTSAGLIIGASRLGLPVSTTHVSASALFGIGIVGGGARGKVIGGILGAWVTTLPVGAALGALGYLALR